MTLPPSGVRSPSSVQQRAHGRGLACRLAPRKLSDCLVCIGFVAFLVGTVARHLVHVDLLDPVTFRVSKWVLLNSLCFAGTVLVAVTSIVSSLRSIRRHGFSLGRLAGTLVGLSICIMYAVFSAYMAGMLESGLRMVTDDSETLTKLESALSRSDLSDKKRAVLSKMYAEGRFWQKGDLVDYFTPEGRIVRFQPTAEDLRLRRTQVMVPPILASAIAHLRKGPIEWATVGLVSIALGLLTPLRREGPSQPLGGRL